MSEYARLVAADMGDRVSQLVEQHAELKAEADAAAEKLKAATDALKLAATQAAPDASTIELAGTSATLKVSARTSWRLDTKALKTELPETYVRYAKQQTSWTLTAVKQ